MSASPSAGMGEDDFLHRPQFTLSTIGPLRVFSPGLCVLHIDTDLAKGECLQRQLLPSGLHIVPIAEPEPLPTAVEVAKKCSPTLVVIRVREYKYQLKQLMPAMKKAMPQALFVGCVEDVYPHEVERLRAIGFNGLVGLNCNLDEIVQIIFDLLQNSFCLKVRYLENPHYSSAMERYNTLTKTQKLRICDFGHWKSREQIAKEAFVTTGTVDKHLQDSNQKLEIKTEKDLMDFLIRFHFDYL